VSEQESEQKCDVAQGRVMAISYTIEQSAHRRLGVKQQDFILSGRLFYARYGGLSPKTAMIGRAPCRALQMDSASW
jgi:hypothetical protein